VTKVSNYLHPLQIPKPRNNHNSGTKQQLEMRQKYNTLSSTATKAFQYESLQKCFRNDKNMISLIN